MVCPSWLSFILYNPVRKAFTNREAVLAESGISADSVVLEIGAGNGFFTELLAARAKRVYAVELQEGMARKLLRRVQHSGDKVTIITGDVASLSLADELPDVCLVYCSFHEISDKAGAARSICSAVRHGGVVSIYEPTVEVSRVAMQKTVALFTTCGLEAESRRDGFFTRFARLKKT